MKSKPLIALLFIIMTIALTPQAKADDAKTYCISDPDFGIVSKPGKYQYLGYNCHNFANDFCDKSKLDARILVCRPPRNSIDESDDKMYEVSDKDMNDPAYRMRIGGLMHTVNVVPSTTRDGDICFIDPQAKDGDGCCYTPKDSSKKDACGSVEVDLNEASAMACYSQICGEQAGRHYDKAGNIVADGFVFPKNYRVSTSDEKNQELCIPLVATSIEECKKCCENVYAEDLKAYNFFKDNDDFKAKKEKKLITDRLKMCKKSCQDSYAETQKNLQGGPTAGAKPSKPTSSRGAKPTVAQSLSPACCKDSHGVPSWDNSGSCSSKQSPLSSALCRNSSPSSASAASSSGRSAALSAVSSSASASSLSISSSSASATSSASSASSSSASAVSGSSSASSSVTKPKATSLPHSAGG